MSVPALHVENLTRRFGGGLFGLRPPHVAVDGVSFDIAPGERVALIGESGSGKTTLARTALGLWRPDAGRVQLFGEGTSTWGERRWRTARHQVQILFQDPRSMLNPAMRVGRLLHESAVVHRPESDPEVETERALEMVGLGGRAEAWPHELSGGEQRRVGLARVLLARPKLLVADEPTAGLDAALKASLVETMLASVGPDCAVVLISHDLPVVAWACSRVLVMHEGRIVDVFATSEMTSGRHPQTRRLLAAAGLVEAA